MGNKISSTQITPRVTLKDISRASGICLSSVSKALSGNEGVSKETRAIVIETAEKMGYRVNRLAQSLSRNDLLIGVIAPSIWAEYYGLLEHGIELELHALQDYRISAVYQKVSNLYSTDEIVDAIHQLMDAHVNAIILCPNFSCNFNDELEKLADMNFPVVILGNRLRGARSLMCVHPNSQLVGQLAAEFMGYLLEPGKTSAIFIGNKNLDDHVERARSYCAYPGITANPNTMSDVFETLDEPEIAYAITQKILRERSDIGGIYVATSNSVAVCNCIRDMGLQGVIKVIGTDTFPGMESLFSEGLLNGVIFQDPVRQGELAVRALFDYLTIRKECPPEILVNPQLVLSSNFTYYLSDIHAAEDSTAESN